MSLVGVSPQSEVGVGPDELRRALDECIRQNLPTPALGLAAFHFAVNVRYLAVIAPVPQPLIALSAGTLLTLLLFVAALTRWSIPLAWTHPVAVALASLLLCNVFVHIHHRPGDLTFGLGCFLLGLGFLFPVSGWLGAVLVVAIARWTYALNTMTPAPLWLNFAFPAIATGAALLVHTARFGILRDSKRYAS